MTRPTVFLKRCPCGAIPKGLCIIAEGDKPKWARCSGDCCGEWEIEFRAGYEFIDSDNIMNKAIYAWNDASRGFES